MNQETLGLLRRPEHPRPGPFHLPLPPEMEETPGRFITTAAVHLSVTMNVPKVPTEGDQIRASRAVSAPGGGYIVAAAVRAQGVGSRLASPLGTGPNSHSIRRSLQAAGISAEDTALVGDIGVAVTMVEDDGTTAIVVAPGVESEPNQEILDRVVVGPHDVVHVSGADLVTEQGARTLVEWLSGLPDEITVVVAATPAASAVNPETWVQVLRRADVLTMNIRESAALTTLLGEMEGGAGIKGLLRPTAAIVRRRGQLGCDVSIGVDGASETIPAFLTETVDTSGVGDTHVAVMCAALIQGFPLDAACKRANAASAIELAHRTSFPLPTRAQVERVLEGEPPARVALDLEVTD